MPHQPWDGHERRQESRDHDTLIAIVQILNNHVANFEKHIVSDLQCFKELRDTVHKLERCMWIATGVVAVFHVLPGILLLIRTVKGVL